MKKSLQSFFLMAFLLLVGSSAWAAGYTRTLTNELEVSGYKAKAFYDFQTNDPAVLPTSGDLRYRPDDGIWGLHNFGSGTRSGVATIPVAEGDILVLQHYSKDVVSTINRGSLNSSLTSSTGYQVYDITSEADDVTFTIARYGGIVAAFVMEVDQSATKASYTLNYINGELAVKSVNGELAVGATVPTDASFFVEDAKYIRKAGEPESFTIAEGENNFSVKVRPAETFNYSLVSSLGATLTSGSGLEGEKVYAGYPRYQLSEGKFYTAGVTNKEYRKTIVLTEDNVSATVDYDEWNGSNDVVFYAEGENIDGFTVSTAGNIPARASNAKAGTAAEDVTITTLPAGKYKLHVGIFTSASSGYADKVINFGVGSETFAAAFTGVNLNEITSDEITLTENSDVKFIAEGSWTNAQFDYIWIEKTGDYVPVVTSYAVTISDEIENGKVVADPTSANAGAEVTLTNTPAEGYEFVSYSVTGVKSNEAVPVTDGKFTMPADDVTVSATFAKVYAVTISDEIENGKVVADPTSAKAGDEVTLTNTPAEGYEFVSYSVTGVKSNEAVPVTDGKFTMPADDVTVSATFAKVYAVTISDEIENGKVVADPTSAKAGEEVTITATPAEGYELASISVTGQTSNLAVEVTDGKFTMPADDVTVSAKFQQKAVDPSGDEEVALAADMFYTWDGYGADASKIASATVDFKVGESVGAGTTVVGTGSVDYLTYADMTGSTKVIFEGTDGTVIRLLMNRQESNNGPYVEKNATIAEGKAEISLTDLTYVHVNAIKIPYNESTGNIISAITFVKPNDPLAGPKEALKDAIAAAKMQNSVAKTEESFAALTKAISDGEAALADAQATVESLTTAKTDIETAVKGLTLAEGYAEVTKEMFKQYASVEEPGEGTATGGAYELFTASGLPYGDSSVSELKWADLTKYDKLIVTVAGNVAPRLCMNRLVKDGQQAATQEESKMLDINPNNGNTWSTEKYQTASDGVYTIDLAAIVKDYTFARLHCIKKQGWGAGVVVTGMYLHEAPAPVVYAVTISDEIENGTVVADPTSAKEGDEVTLTNTPAEGYEFVSYSVTGVHEDLAVIVTDGKFTMPADDVTVSATFQKKSVIYIETDLTKDFISLTAPTTWKSENTSNVGQATWAAPQVTVAGSKYYMNENYVGTQALKEVTGGVMYNEITGLTPGLYTIELYGSAAVTVRDDITATFTEGDEASLHAVTLYAESNGEKVSKYIPCLIETNFNNRGGEESIPTATLDNVVVGSDGKIKIGLYKEVGLTNWHIVQLKSVTAKVSASDLLAKAIADAQGVAESDVPAKLYSEIQTAIETYDKEYATADEYQTAINALNALVDKANGYVTLTAVLNEGDQYKANVPAEDPAIAAYDAAIADVKGAYDDAVVADIPAAVKVVEAALPALAKAQTAPGSDLTTLVNNTSWTCPQGNGPGKYQEIYTETYNESAYQPGKVIYQKIEGLIPGGVYEVKFLAVANTAWGKSNFGDGLAQVYANEVTSDISVIEQNNCNPTEYEQTLTAEVGDDGVFEYGMQNVAAGGNWYVVKGVSMTLKEVIISYSVDIAEGIENGTVEVSAKKAAAGEEVTITATPAEGYELVSVSVKGVTSDIAVQVVTDEVTGEMSFTMPKDAVEVSATFKEIAYPITYAIGMQNGTVEGPVESVAGEKVTLTVTPAEGYELENLTITCAESQNEINYDVVDYSFTMPKEGVYIIATFVQTTGIDAASAAKGKKIGVKKYFKNGELIIIGKDGKEFRANGAAK